MSIRALFVVVVCLPAASALAGFQAVEDFALLNPGNLSGQGDWYATAGTAEVVADPVDAANQVMAVSTNSGLVRHPMAVPNNEAHMMFFRLRFGVQQKYSIGLSPYSSPTQFDDFATEVGMANESNDLQVWDDEATPNYAVLQTLMPDTWYNVWVYIDNADDDYRVWINNAPGFHAHPADQLADGDNSLFDFRAGGLSDLRTFYIKTGGGGAPGAPDGPVYIDDIYLENASGAIDLKNPLGLAGDYTGDGFVGIGDLDIVLRHWNQTVTPGDLLAGDGSGDGFVGIADLDEVLATWNTGAPPVNANIPEPAALVVLGLVLAASLGHGAESTLRRMP